MGRRVSEWLKKFSISKLSCCQRFPPNPPPPPFFFSPLPPPLSLFIFKAVDVVIKNLVRARSGHLVSQIRAPSEILSSVLLRRQR